MDALPRLLPVLPIRNAVLFPSISMPLVVGRPRSLAALENAAGSHDLLVIVTQRLMTQGDPEPADLHAIGTLCKLESNTAGESGSHQIVVTGLARFRLTSIEEGDALMTRGELILDSDTLEPIRKMALLGALKSLAKEILELLPASPESLLRLVEKVEDPAYLSHVCAAYLNLPLTTKQELLEEADVERRVDRTIELMRREREVLSVQREIRDKMSDRLNKAQREALLREQLRTIRSELGEESSDDPTDEIEERIARVRLPEDVERVALDELRRLRQLPAASAEHHVIRNWLDWICAMPWRKTTQDRIDLEAARRVLDADHYGLESVKRRILQFLAVAQLTQSLRGPLLCLVGPPGVGKTSLGQSIATSLRRKFVRASLGGIRDEAEIRGHRRTYVGAMPGRIIQNLKRVGVRNPVILLDEIDKIRMDFHGDPSSALLEVLDPEQNRTFVDHYLDVPFDLSDVFFIGTANQVDTIPPALRDRLEIIEVHGYNPREKREIAKRHLVPRELASCGLDPATVELSDAMIDRIIHDHTREAGVRDLRRRLSTLFRTLAEEEVERRRTEGGGTRASSGDASNGAAPAYVVDEDRLTRALGRPRLLHESTESFLPSGVAMGLAWTPMGGEILFLETDRTPGTGRIQLTGQMGDVMKESARIAITLLRGHFGQSFGITSSYAEFDHHVHIPAGAIPKDGPSAGLTMLAALASLWMDRPLPPTTAMSGEITLRGSILPVGGIVEKCLAAHRAGVKRILLPARNEPDLEDLPADLRSELHFVFVERIEQAFHALFGETRRPLRVIETSSSDAPASQGGSLAGPNA